jgi:hypothetical protein
MEGKEDLTNINNDEDKDKLKNKVTHTQNKLQDNLMTSLEAMNSTISNLHNTLSEENDDIITYNDCQNDIKDKLNVMANISNGLVANIEVIKNSKGSDKRVLNIKKFVKILDLTKDQDIQQYFYSMEIYGY